MARPYNNRKRIITCKLQYVARKDRLDSSDGGEATVAKHDFVASKVDTTARSEFVAASLTCKDLKKPIILGCMYRPIDNKVEYTLDHLQCSNWPTYTKFIDHIIWLCEDTNLPDNDWKTDTIIGHSYPVPINQAHINIFNHIGCEHTANFLTRIDKILDVLMYQLPILSWPMFSNTRPQWS